jgi:acetoacetyl-CoA synthetase
MVIDVEDGAGGSELIMFVVPDEGNELHAEAEAAIASAIRTGLSPRFVPDRLIAAPAIPLTLSGKKQELPIKRLFAGWPVAKVINADATATPEILPWYIEQARRWQSSKAKAGGASDVKADR